ncbi:MAG TPA: ATP-binding protein [Gaiellaceae bacterium]
MDAGSGPVVMPEVASDAAPARARPTPSVRGLWQHASFWPRRWRVAWWEVGAAVVGVAAAAAAVVVTLQADFLAYPGWLAVQKADVVLGPIGVGLYWRHRRPRSRFGPMLIALGLVNAVYIAQSSSDSALFTLGVHWELVIYLATLAIILAFPSGRLTRADWGILAAGALVAAVSAASTLLSTQISGGGSISACRAECPANALLISDEPHVVSRLVDVDRWAIVAVALTTAALLLFRLVKGTPPQRRALAVGTPIALVFLLVQASFQLTMIAGGTDAELNTVMRWTFVVARSLLWYGFLLALVAAELFAGRVLRRIVGESLRRPTLRELEALLRAPLGDPGLRLGFWQPRTRVWVDGDGGVLEPPAPGSGRRLTEVDRNDRPAVAIVHDAQLSDDPELLQAAGATALLARENAELQAAWNESLRELRGSRARIAAASDRERLRLERDLHDGPQQALVALRIRLALAAEQAVGEPTLHDQLWELGEDLERALDELRDLAHGIYPNLLSDAGLVRALTVVTTTAGPPVELTSRGVGRYSIEIESGFYYCCREALQNAVRHAGAAARITVHLHDDGHDLRFEVRDDGVGFDPAVRSDGAGLHNMEDRIGMLDGRFELRSAPGVGTVVSGSVPLRR